MYKSFQLRGGELVDSSRRVPSVPDLRMALTA